MNMNRAVIVAAFAIASASIPLAFAQAPAGDVADKAGEKKSADKDVTGYAERYAECRDMAVKMAPQTSARRQHIENALERCKQEAKAAPTK